MAGDIEKNAQPSQAAQAAASAVPEEDDLPGEEESSFDASRDSLPAPSGQKPAEAQGPQAPPASPSETPAKQERKHSRLALRQARDLGFTPDQVATLSEDELEDLIYDRNTQLHAAAHARLSAGAPAEGRSPAPAEEEDKIDLGFDESLVDENIVKVMKDLKKTTKEQEKELRRLQAERQQEAASSVGRHVNNTIDEGFASMGKKYEKVFGTGQVEKLADQKARHRRQAVVAVAAQQLLAAGAEPTPRDIARHLKEAAESLYGDLVAEDDTPPAETPAQKKWKEGGLARPTQKESREPKGEKRAVQAVKELLEKRQAVAVAEGDDEESTLPD